MNTFAPELSEQVAAARFELTNEIRNERLRLGSQYVLAPGRHRREDLQCVLLLITGSSHVQEKIPRPAPKDIIVRK
jgi:hypothetical protein